jgi:NAD(P)-dependent dehydrogenase (short-subunit alcohol dehydrogenase family)
VSGRASSEHGLPEWDEDVYDMKVLGVMTEDFAIYYELVKALKKRHAPFVSLSFKDPIPHNVGLIITTLGELDHVDFPRKAAAGLEDIEDAIELAIHRLKGKDSYRSLVIGIDPGKTPGIGVLGDDEVIFTALSVSPEDVRSVVKRVIREFPHELLVVRIGHGDLTRRNRIINSLANMELNVEIVDETGTTPPHTEYPDIDAAINIAGIKGNKAQPSYPVEPTEGELHEIQRRSRIKSEGRVTISKELAERVLRGELSMNKAIWQQMKKHKEKEH